MHRSLARACVSALAPLLAATLAAARADEARADGARDGKAHADFTGLSLGVQTGYGFGASDWCYCNFVSPTIEATGGDGGVLGGAHIAYAVRLGPLVAEAQARLSYATLAFSETCGTDLACTGELQWLGETDLAVGLVVGDTMLAAIAGLAAGDVRALTIVTAGPASGATRDETAIHDGTVFGARLEQAMAGGWRYALEYRYYDMKGANDAAAASGAPAKVDIDWHAHAVGLTIAYELGL